MNTVSPNWFLIYFKTSMFDSDSPEAFCLNSQYLTAFLIWTSPYIYIQMYFQKNALEPARESNNRIPVMMQCSCVILNACFLLYLYYKLLCEIPNRKIWMPTHRFYAYELKRFMYVYGHNQEIWKNTNSTFSHILMHTFYTYIYSST